MKTILVVAFIVHALHGEPTGFTTWRKDMKTEVRCLLKAAELKAKNPKLDVKCVEPINKGGK